MGWVEGWHRSAAEQCYVLGCELECFVVVVLLCLCCFVLFSFEGCRALCVCIECFEGGWLGVHISEQPCALAWAEKICFFEPSGGLRKHY